MAPAPRAAGTRARRRCAWQRYEDERLLDLRFRDLDLRIESTPVQRRVERLYGELERRGIHVRPHVWLSTEWFSPDGIPGIAIPFYLAHPRLARLEARQMLEVEGGDEISCMRVLRHEAGHAVGSAYRLHLRKRWRAAFGSFSKPYPETYRPDPSSRNFVLHLGAWYAQAHPAEDFAETFAVWLAPRSNWRERYAGWPKALGKLEVVDALMADVRGRPAPVRSRARVEPLSRLSQTLREHYKEKRKRFAAEWSQLYDRDLRRLFTNERGGPGRPAAAQFLRRIRSELRTAVSEWTGAHPYTIDQVLQDVIDRSRELKLRLALPPDEAKMQAVLLLTVHTMNCIYAGRQEIPL